MKQFVFISRENVKCQNIELSRVSSHALFSRYYKEDENVSLMTQVYGVMQLHHGGGLDIE